MRLVDIYRARYDGRPSEALAAATQRLRELETQDRTVGRWLEMWGKLMFLKGDCLLDLGHFIAAEACFHKVFIETGNPVALANRGYARWRRGLLQEAEADYLRAIDMPGDDENKEVRLRNLSEIYLESGNITAASIYLMKARDLVGDTFEVTSLQNEIDRKRV